MKSANVDAVEEKIDGNKEKDCNKNAPDQLT
jgi:hypothetical protein